jgi:hypothetical protein
VTAYADQCTRVYTYTGRVAHLMPLHEHSVSYGVALCPVRPRWPDQWRGTGSQQEIELAASLPPCSRCKALAARDDAYRAKAAQR